MRYLVAERNPLGQIRVGWRITHVVPSLTGERTVWWGTVRDRIRLADLIRDVRRRDRRGPWDVSDEVVALLGGHVPPGTERN